MAFSLRNYKVISHYRISPNTYLDGAAAGAKALRLRASVGRRDTNHHNNLPNALHERKRKPRIEYEMKRMVPMAQRTFFEKSLGMDSEKKGNSSLERRSVGCGLIR